MVRYPSALKELARMSNFNPEKKNCKVIENERKTQKPNACNLSEKG